MSFASSIKSVFSRPSSATPTSTPISIPSGLTLPAWQTTPNEKSNVPYYVYNPSSDDEREERKSGTKRARTPTSTEAWLSAESTRHTQAYVRVNPHHSILETTSNIEVTVSANISFPPYVVYGLMTYFEVTCTRIDASAAVAIGFTAEPYPDTKTLPGWRNYSWAFHSDDGLCHSNGQSHPFSIPWGIDGDIIGCGITHAGDIFYTKNGVMLGLAFTRVYPRRALTPCIGTDRPGKLCINFGRAPFRFDLATLVTTMATPTPRPPQHNTIIQRVILMPHITTRIISMMARTPHNVCTMARVCHEWRTIITTPTHANALWQHVARAKWPHIPASTMKMASWQMFVKERMKALKQGGSDVPIENCSLSIPIQIPDTLQWKFQCPVAFQLLTRTADPKIDHCSVCNKNVYLSQSQEELIQNVEMGRCVAFDTHGSIHEQRHPLLRMMGMGMVAH